MLKSVKAFVLQPFVNKFASQFRQITPSADTTMAVIRNTSSARRVGRVGNTTYYVANGQQIARQSRNDSNYGIDASRSRAQQMRRVKWANLVNIYKACRTWMPKAFETKKTSQSDYNKFMSLNINTSSVCLTKTQAIQGCAVMASYTVSQGSLPPIRYSGEDVQGTNIITSIRVGNIPIAGSTVAEITSAILSNNPEFLDGDNIAIVLFKTSEPKAAMPYTSTSYAELTLDSKSTKTLSSLPVGAWLDVKNSALAVKQSMFGLDKYQCVAIIHTRKVGGSLMTSTQQAYPNITDYWDEYSTADQEEKAIASYGVNEDVPLDPSFKLGSILSVKIDDVVSPYIKGSIVVHSGSCTLTVVGDNLTADNYELRFDNTVFTPLVEDGNNKTYILSYNGTARIFVNGVLYGGVTIQGADVPSEMRGGVYLFNIPSDRWNNNANDPHRESDKYFVNFPIKVTSSNNRFMCYVNVTGDITEDDINVVGGSLHAVSRSVSDNNLIVAFEASTSARVTYVSYKGYIFAVTNYSK